MENEKGMETTRLFAVTGRPILHSLSPQIQNAAIEAAGINAVYTRLAAGSARGALDAAKAIGICGLNVTSPFKEEMARLCDTLNESAERTGAANTVILRDGKVFGYNTDVVGVRDTLIENGARLKDANAVVIGAGGAAKAAVVALVDCGAKVTIANRTVEKAKQIAKQFGCAEIGLLELRGVVPHAEIIISAINPGSSKNEIERIVPHGSLAKETVVLDANYSKESALVLDARAAGCKIIDGREWLLHQGVAAFEIFTGKKAHIDAMKAALQTAKPNKKHNIALIGFMGSGKTTVAKEITRISGMMHIDIDENIERRSGTKIKEIFENHGEMKFREMESEEILAVDGANNTVIACGGGAILNPHNSGILRNNCTVVWLTASPKTIFERIGDDESRPLLNVENREDVARRIIEKRIPLYARTADIIVHTDSKSADEVARSILDEHNH